ncbi:MAG: hypothetical protein IT530_14450 [Burkholderiales bacterium]|nr:hypothetical protein [Burkholderiales bacterium]
MKVDRIVAGLHPGHRSARVLEAAAKRAHALDAELVGLFIEDIDLLHFAAMPFACEIDTVSGRRRSVDRAAMERYMSVRAAEMREALHAAAGRSAVHWSFRVARGTVADQLIAVGVEQEGTVLLLPPGADIDQPPRIVSRAQLERIALIVRGQQQQPILLVSPDAPAEG